MVWFLVLKTKNSSFILSGRVMVCFLCYRPRFSPVITPSSAPQKPWVRALLVVRVGLSRSIQLSNRKNRCLLKTIFHHHFYGNMFTVENVTSNMHRVKSESCLTLKSHTIHRFVKFFPIGYIT